MRDARIPQKRQRSTRAPIRTNVFELIQELSRLTDDDHLVIAAVKSIFQTYRVTALRALAPVKLVATKEPSGRRVNMDVGGLYGQCG